LFEIIITMATVLRHYVRQWCADYEQQIVKTSITAAGYQRILHVAGTRPADEFANAWRLRIAANDDDALSLATSICDPVVIGAVLLEFGGEDGPEPVTVAIAAVLRCLVDRDDPDEMATICMFSRPPDPDQSVSKLGFVTV
jgi:hypothetical protein